MTTKNKVHFRCGKCGQFFTYREALENHPCTKSIGACKSIRPSRLDRLRGILARLVPS